MPGMRNACVHATVLEDGEKTKGVEKGPETNTEDRLGAWLLTKTKVGLLMAGSVVSSTCSILSTHMATQTFITSRGPNTLS